MTRDNVQMERKPNRLDRSVEEVVIRFIGQLHCSGCGMEGAGLNNFCELLFFNSLWAWGRGKSSRSFMR